MTKLPKMISQREHARIVMKLAAEFGALPPQHVTIRMTDLSRILEIADERLSADHVILERLYRVYNQAYKKIGADK